VPQQLAEPVAAQFLLDFRGVLERQRRGPLRRQSRMHHHPAQRPVRMHQRLGAQPVEQFARIGREQHALQVRVHLALLVGRALADRQQRQVVVAQHGDAIRAQRMHQAQRFQRLAAAVDEVAAKPEPVARRVEADAFPAAAGWGRGSPASLRSPRCSCLGV